MMLSATEKTQLAGTLGCEVKDLRKALRGYQEAALEEYQRMILGQKVFTRGTDIREYRLYLLIKHVYAAVLPSELAICNHFQLTSSQARALLRAVMSKYQYELHDEIQNSLRAALSDSSERFPGGPMVFTPESENIVDALNLELGTINGNLKPIGKVRNSVNTYEIDLDSFDELQRRIP